MLGEALKNQSVELFVPFPSLFLILLNVLLLQLSHPLNLIEVHHETFIIRVELFDALSTENCQMIRTVKMFHSLWMIITQFLL
jgi:hypothetical protein